MLLGFGATCWGLCAAQLDKQTISFYANQIKSEAVVAITVTFGTTSKNVDLTGARMEIPAHNDRRSMSKEIP